MQLTPRYGTAPVLVLDGPPDAVAEPADRQRRRLAETLATLTDEQWAQPSRCEEWTCREVIVHLESANRFWTYSISAGLAGEPSRFMAAFDPVATPLDIVAAEGALSNDEVLDRFVASAEALTDLLSSLGDDGWATLAEAPPGHVAIGAVAHHALWDSWVHERDVMLPLGLVPDEEPDEIAASLRYVAALGPTFVRTSGGTRRGTLVVAATDPDVRLVVEVDDPIVVRDGSADADLCLGGRSVDLLEALSMRAPLDQAVPEGSAWILGGLASAFDQAGPG